MDDVWVLETDIETVASEDLNLIIDKAMTFHGVRARNYLKRLWEEKWYSIKRKLLTEGSVWYVWYMDGVRQHITNYPEFFSDSEPA